MATITGTRINRYVDDFNDNLVGTYEDDTIHGLGGDDTIWGSGGNDYMVGGTGDDYITPTNPTYHSTYAAWGLDDALGGAGNDTLDFAKTSDPVGLWGEAGDDLIFGGGGSDTIAGGADVDWLDGNGGHDQLWGEAGDDYIIGGSGFDDLYGGDGYDDLLGGTGDDYLVGGAVGDTLTGGAGFDEFVFSLSDGVTTQWEYSDTITDFDHSDGDSIVMDVAGTEDNFRSGFVRENAGWDAALAEANFHMTAGVNHVFISDHVDGYLFSDQDSNGYFDTGVELQGLTSVTDLTHYDII